MRIGRLQPDSRITQGMPANLPAPIACDGTKTIDDHPHFQAARAEILGLSGVFCIRIALWAFIVQGEAAPTRRVAGRYSDSSIQQRRMLMAFLRLSRAARAVLGLGLISVLAGGCGQSSPSASDTTTVRTVAATSSPAPQQQSDTP